MDKWTHKFKKRHEEKPAEKPEEKVAMPPVQEAMQNQPEEDCTIKYVAQTKAIRNLEDAKSEKQIAGIFSKRRLSYVWGWIAVVCIFAILISAYIFSKEQEVINRESAPIYDVDFSNSKGYLDFKTIKIKDETPKRFNPYTILIVFSSLFFVTSLTAWLSVQMKDVKVILQKKNGKVYFTAKGSFFSAKYTEVKEMCAYQLLCRKKNGFDHFLILALETEFGDYALGDSIDTGNNYGLEMRDGGYSEIQLYSVDGAVSDMARFLGLL